MTAYLPAAKWIRSCTPETIGADVLAGFALGALLIPQGLAYAGIAGVPPQAGLFALAAGLLVYGMFGSSRHLAVAPTSGPAAMLAALVGALAAGDAAKYMLLASATAICVGILLLTGAAFRLGFVSEFIAKPVLKGFVFGLSLTIMLKQLPKILGVRGGAGDFFDQLWTLLSSLNHIHLWTLAIGASALAITFGLNAIVPRVPAALVVFTAGIIASRVLGLQQHGVELVGAMQGGVPHPVFPMIERAEWSELLSGAVGIVFILYAEALAAGRTFAAKNNYEINPNQELAALGAANIASGLFQGIVVGGGMSGTAANASGGARTQLSAVVTSMLALITLGFLMPLFEVLPQAVLGAIVINAVARLADVKELKRFAHLRTGSIYTALTALVGVLAFGILKGLVLAVVLTLIALMKKLTTPQESTLGRLRATGTFVDLKRYPDAELIPGLLIVRPNAILFFANANRVIGRVRQLVRESTRPIRAVLLNLEAVPELDVTSLDLLEQLRIDLQVSGVQLLLARVADPVRDLFSLSGFSERVGEHSLFRGVDAAVDSFIKSTPTSAASGS